MFLAGQKVFTALISPMVPMEIRSSIPIPVDSNFLAIYTTSRRLCVISSSRAPGIPRRMVSGVISVRVTEDFVLPGGFHKSIACDKTILVETEVIEEETETEEIWPQEEEV